MFVVNKLTISLESVIIVLVALPSMIFHSATKEPAASEKRPRIVQLFTTVQCASKYLMVLDISSGLFPQALYIYLLSTRMTCF